MKNYVYLISITLLITILSLIDILTIANITITCIRDGITLNDFLFESGGKFKGANYSKGAGLVAMFFIQIPIFYFLIQEIRKIKLND